MKKKNEIDIQKIRKGDSIEIKEMERVTGEKHGTIAYQFKAMQIAQEIQKQRPELVVRIDHGAVRVLVDSEASTYCDDRFRAHFDGMQRSHFKQQSVDVSNLKAAEKQQHEHCVRLQSAVLAAALKVARREVFEIKDTGRAVPALPMLPSIDATL